MHKPSYTNIVHYCTIISRIEPKDGSLIQHGDSEKATTPTWPVQGFDRLTP